jgi:voltage-dependent anion channel protein 2
MQIKQKFVILSRLTQIDWKCRSLITFSSGPLQVQLLVPYKVEYFYKNAALSTRLPSTSRHIIQLSATFGAPHLAFGMETPYNLASKRFHEFNAGIRVTKPNFDGSITL